MAEGKGLDKPLNLSPELEAIVGKGPMSRKLVIKGLWEYIKSNKLQDSNDGRIINPDDKLGKVLGGEAIHMLKMGKAITAHVS